MPADPIIGGIIGTGMGLALQGVNDKRQRRQSEMLMRQQMQGQKEMYDYQQQKQYDMWLKTNYPAQVEQLNKAGLNPALLYGMGGAGGATVGGGVPSVQGGDGPKGGGEIRDMIGMGLQTGMMKAQIKVMETQAAKNAADAAATAGVQTEVGKQQIAESAQRVQNLMQGYDNMRQEYDIKLLEKTMRNIENFEKQASQQDRLSYIKSQAQTAANIVRSTAVEAKIDEATVNDKINTIQEQAINAALQNVNLRATTRKTEAEINSITQNIMREWDYLSNDNQRLQIMKQLKDWDTDETREGINQILRVLPSIMDLRPRSTKTFTGSTKSGNTTTTRSQHTHQ